MQVLLQKLLPRYASEFCSGTWKERLWVEFITQHRPQQNGMVERVIRALKEQCARRHRFEGHIRDLRLIAGRIVFCNQQ
ncbi:hypothetical protein ABW43_19700 [Stenotrophomonas maltophilia]|nr:hypothetical protein ABW43_19700 [Stenotrophomonas maltophilia]